MKQNFPVMLQFDKRRRFTGLVIFKPNPEKARGGGVKQFPESAGQLPVVQSGRRQRRVTEAREDLARRTPRTILGWTAEPGCVVGHESFLGKRGGRHDRNVA